VITIQASDVTLDLNGKTLQITSTSNSLISIDTGVSTLRVSNGKLLGGALGIFHPSAVGPILLDVENVALLNQSSDAIEIAIAGGEVAISDCSFRNVGNNGILIFPSGVTTSGARIVGNVFSHVSNRAIELSGVRSFAVLSNTISDTLYGIQLDQSGLPGVSGRVQGNILESMGTGPNSGISVSGFGSVRETILLLDNVVSGFGLGIVASNLDGARIAGNVVHRGVTTGGATGDGIYLSSLTQALIEDNQIQGNAGCGIVFTATASGNAYRNNMLRGNTGGAVCNSGAGTTDAGGNIL